MNLKDAYDYSRLFLSGNKIDESDFKALCVVCSLADIKNNQFETHTGDFVSNKKLADMLWKLKSGEPLQYVLGKWDFYESEFYVGKGVLIPRPETEELADAVIKAAKKLLNPIVYDLCSGSGCIGISVAKAVPDSKVYCIEKSDEAFKYLLENCKMAENAIPVKGDICLAAEITAKEKADIIVSNPPYIKTGDICNLQSELSYEPEMALDGGTDGLFFYRVISDNWESALKPGGKLFLEIGEDQGDSVSKILSESEFKNIQIKKDIYQNVRMVFAEK